MGASFKERQSAFLCGNLPDYDTNFAKEEVRCSSLPLFVLTLEDLSEFARAISASDYPDPELEYIVTSLNEWQVPKERPLRSRNASTRTADEGREGYSYRLLRWPAFVSTTFEPSSYA
jgi:hypothetical protein